MYYCGKSSKEIKFQTYDQQIPSFNGLIVMEVGKSSNSNLSRRNKK